MGEVNLSSDVWTVIACIAALLVFLCLGVLAIAAEYELNKHRLRRDVRKLKDPLGSYWKR